MLIDKYILSIGSMLLNNMMHKKFDKLKFQVRFSWKSLIRSMWSHKKLVTDQGELAPQKATINSQNKGWKIKQNSFYMLNRSTS
jgi:hypothetical protein